MGCGALRRIDETTIEVKRMYVVPEARGTGVAGALLDALHREAAAAGATRMVLETGPEQPEALALYCRAGYAQIPCFGAYADSPHSLCFARNLP